MTQNRVPEGVPTGGQFAAETKARSAVSLDSVAADIAGAKADEAYADYVVAVDSQNNTAVTVAATAVRDVFPTASRIYVVHNPDYIHDGMRYAIDRITDADNTVLADKENWPADGTPESKTLFEAEYAIGVINDNDIDPDSGGALSEIPNMACDEDFGSEQDYINVEASANPQSLEDQKQVLGAAMRRTAESVGAMNTASFDAIDQLAARDFPDVAQIVVSRDSDKFYQIESLRGVDGEDLEDLSGAEHPAIDRLNPYVQNFHEGYAYLTDSAFMSRLEVPPRESNLHFMIGAGR